MWGDSNQQMPGAPTLVRVPVRGWALNEHTGTHQSSVKKGAWRQAFDAYLLH